MSNATPTGPSLLAAVPASPAAGKPRQPLSAEQHGRSPRAGKEASSGAPHARTGERERVSQPGVDRGAARRAAGDARASRADAETAWASALSDATEAAGGPAVFRREKSSQTGNNDELGQVLSDLRREAAPPVLGANAPASPVAELDQNSALAGHGLDRRTIGGAALLDFPGIQPDTRTLDVLPQPQGGREPVTLSQTPWLGLGLRDTLDAQVVPSATQAAPARPGAQAGTLRSTLAATLPERLDTLGQQATGIEIDHLQDALREAPPPRAVSAQATADAQAVSRGAGAEQTDLAQRGLSPAAPEAEADSSGSASADSEPSAGDDFQARGRRPVTGGTTPRPTTHAANQTTTPFQTAVDNAVGDPQRLPDGVRVTRVATSSPAAIASGRSVDASMFQQNVVADMQRVDLEVRDGDDKLRVTLAREVDGLAVEVRSPRDLVAELRALRPEVEQAFAEEGHDLAAFDAEEDPSLEREADDEADGWATDSDPAGAPTDGTTTRHDAHHDGLFSRRA